MNTGRLDVRLDLEHQRKLKELAAEYGAPVSETVRRLIDQAFDDSLRARRARAADSLAELEIEDVPEPAALNRQLEEAYEPGDLS